MGTDTKYPTTATQTTGGHYRTFTNLKNICNSSGGYAESTHSVQGKTGTYYRPSTITVKNFKFHAPTNSRIKKITVEYSIRKLGTCTTSAHAEYACTTNKKVCNIGAPTITLLNAGGTFSIKGQAPTVNASHVSRSFKCDIPANTINNSNFGVKFDLPNNTNNYTGFIRIGFIRVKIEYVTQNYGIKLEKISGGYNKEEYVLGATISNLNNTDGNPSVTITTPAGFNYTGKSGNGSIRSVDNHTFVWTPTLKHGVGSSKVQLKFDLNVTYSSGSSSYPYTFVGAISGFGSGTFSGTITEAPVPPQDDSDVDDPYVPTSDDDANDPKVIDIVKNYKNYPTVLKIKLTGNEDLQQFYLTSSVAGLDILTPTADYIDWEYEDGEYESEDVATTLSTAGYEYTVPGNYGLKIDDIFYLFVGSQSCMRTDLKVVLVDWYSSDVYDNKFPLEFIPEESELSTPYFTVLSPTSEELKRLGDDYSYTVQSYLKTSGYTEYMNNATEQTVTLTGLYKITNVATISNPLQDFIWEFDLKTNGEFTQLYLSNINITDPSDSPETVGFGFNETQFTYGTSDSEEVGYGGTASSNTYYHFKVVKTGNTCDFYVNGTKLGSRPCTWTNKYDTFYIMSVQMGTANTTMSYKNNKLYYGVGDTYVRDWYKNFRIGVFNNPILANQTKYIQVDSTDDYQEVDIVLPTLYSLDDVEVSVDNAVDLVKPDETTETISTSKTFNLTENILPLDLKKNADNNVVLTIEIKENSSTVYTVVYHVNFNQETPLEPTEIIIDNTDYDNLTVQEIFSNAQYWGNCPTKVNEFQSVTCDFTYNKNYPLYILTVGDYSEATNIANIQSTEPCIIESSTYNGRLGNGVHAVSIDDIILDDGSTSEVTLLNYTSGSPFVLYDFPLPDNYGTNEDIAITGIELSGSMEHSDTLVLYAKLKNPKGETGERSIIIDDEDNTFSIGGNGDLWGFTVIEMENLEDWELELQLANLLNDFESTLNFGNLQLTLFYENIVPQDTHVLFEGEDVSYYNAVVKDVVIPQGLETDTEFLNIKGTDTNKPISQNIREKTIEIELELGDSCDLETNTQTLRQLMRLISTEKDQYGKPIPKKVEFGHLPDIYAEYITKNPIDNDIIMGGYDNIKIKLTIPSGTFYSKESTQTNNIGYIQGIANVNPLIRIRATGNELEITELNSKQKFNMNIPDKYKNTGIIEIDCENRIAKWYENNDATDFETISQYVDFNSSWFVLKNEYNFSTTNCVLLVVDYIERW